MAQLNIQATRATAASASAVITPPVRVYSISIASDGGGAGTIILQDNTDSTSLFQADVPSGDVFSTNIPEDGVLFPGGMKVSTITNIDAATIFIDK